MARRFVVPPHRDGGQAQFIEAAVRPVEEEDDGVARSMQWALDHLADPLTVTGLARAARMSDRSYLRHFTARNGTSPMRWVISQRVAASLPLLEAFDGTVEEIAACGGVRERRDVPAPLRARHAHLPHGLPPLLRPRRRLTPPPRGPTEPSGPSADRTPHAPRLPARRLGHGLKSSPRLDSCSRFYRAA